MSQRDPSFEEFDLGKYNFCMSPQGMAKMAANRDPKDPFKNVIWTADPNVELPVLVTKEGPGAAPPITTMELWKQILEKYASQPALSDKVNGKWQTINYQEYYDLVIKFALSLIKYGITERSAVSILGYNCSLWFIDFFGAIFANCLSCGHYLTNGPEAIQYVTEHSDTELFCVENQEYLDKVLQVWDQLPKLKYIVVWKDFKLPAQYQKYAGRVMSHADFMKGDVSENLMNQLEQRMKVQQPGNAVSYVYTSGTTGNPKGGMLSHDNYVWLGNALDDKLVHEMQGTIPRLISFLPLSHVAAQFVDIFLTAAKGVSVFFADAMALKGTLIDYLHEVRPNIFLAVPRVYEKMEEKVRAVLEKKPFIFKWASHVICSLSSMEDRELMLK